MRCNECLCSILLIVIVCSATVCPNVFAQTRSSRPYPDTGLEFVQQPVIEEAPVLSPRDGMHVIDITECPTGRSGRLGEECTYPGTSAKFDAHLSIDTTVVYDTGRNEDQVYLKAEPEDIMAQLYDVPGEVRLSAVFVAPVYDNQFANSQAPFAAPRNFTLKVWNVGNDGFPGDEFYSMDVDEAPNASHIDFDSHEYSFLEIDLPEDEEVLARLPDRIFIGLANKGTDINYLVRTTARTAVQNILVSVVYNTDANLAPVGWYSLGNFAACRNNECVPLDDQVFPIRARFLASLGPTATDDPVELPSGVSLAQNYPNPFNPATSISWTQPVSARVRISVYNLLGQKMATPADGLRPAGEHEVQLDASGWASGVYVYVLETGTHMLTRRMVLLK